MVPFAALPVLPPAGLDMRARTARSGLSVPDAAVAVSA